MGGIVPVTYDVLGNFLVQDDQQDIKVQIFLYANNLNLSGVCWQFRIINFLALKILWNECHSVMQVNFFRIENPIFLQKEENYFPEDIAKKKHEIKNSLLAKISHINSLGNPDDAAFKVNMLLNWQNYDVNCIGIVTSINEFNAIKQKYGFSVVLDRFIENQNVINNAKLEMNYNLELVWSRILESYHFPIRRLEASQIRTWMKNPNNQPLLDTVNQLDLSRLGLTAVPVEISYFLNLTNLDLSRNAITVLPDFLKRLSSIPNGLIVSDNPIQSFFPEIKPFFSDEVENPFIEEEEIEVLPDDDGGNCYSVFSTINGFFSNILDSLIRFWENLCILFSSND